MMRRCMRRAAVVLFLLAGAAGPAGAQQSVTTGTFRGRITNPDGQPIVGAQILVRNEATGFQRGTITDAAGRFVVPLLPPGGPYTVRVSSIGYQTLERAGFELGPGDVVTLNLELAVQAVQLAGVEAVAGAARIDVAQGGVVQRVGPEEVENLPVNGRDFTDFLNLSPLVSPQPEITTGGQFAIGGARPSATNIQVDGADANNIFFGENRGSSRTPFTFSLESIKEFQLITNGFDVEYGSYQGGVMNAVTKGGTNEFHGSAFFYHRNDVLDLGILRTRLTARDFQNVPPRDFRVGQFGASLSGPILRDRLHFFLSVDGQDKQQPVNAGVPGVTGIHPDSMRKFLSILESRYGVRNPGRWFGTFPQAEDNLVLFGRLDWTIGANHRLTLRQNYSAFTQTNDRVGTFEAITNGGPFRDTVYSTVVELNSVLGARAFNTFRFQYSDEVRPRPGHDDGGYLPQIRVTILDAERGNRTITFGGDGIIFRNRLAERKIQFIDNFTLRLGDHTLKLGTNNLWLSTLNEFWLNGNGSYTFNSLTDFANGRPANYSRLTRACPVPLVANAAGERVVCPQYDVPVADFDALEWSVYAQDEWQLTDRFLLTAGLRVTGTDMKDRPGRIPAVDSTFGVPTGIVPDFTGVSPRLSFAYDVGGEARRVVRGGVGLLVGRAPTVLASNVFQTEKPLLSVFCTGAEIPTLDFQELLSVPRGEKNPLACRSGAAPTGRPEYSVFHPDFGLPRTVKANLGYEQLLGPATRLKVDLIGSYTTDNYTVVDLNLGPPKFSLASEEGRPVYVPASQYRPLNAASSTFYARSPNFARVYQNRTDGEARAFNAVVELEHRIGERLRLAVRYGHNRAYDNSTFSCCTSGEGFTGTPTAGDPNSVGDPGDADRGAWGPSLYERRHVLTANARWRGPWGLSISGIWRSQSGTPWTPVVDGDVNGDGVLFNDRAMISKTLQFNNPAVDTVTLANHLLRFKCLREQLGHIARRNSCRNPWWHSLDVRVSKEVRTLRGQSAELLVEFFNLLDGIGGLFCDEDRAAADGNLHRGACGLGNLRAVYTSATNLLRPVRYDPQTGNVVYTVNPGFGEERQSGFEPFQFQIQLGVRYRF